MNKTELKQKVIEIIDLTKKSKPDALAINRISLGEATISVSLQAMTYAILYLAEVIKDKQIGK